MRLCPLYLRRGHDRFCVHVLIRRQPADDILHLLGDRLPGEGEGACLVVSDVRIGPAQLARIILALEVGGAEGHDDRSRLSARGIAGQVVKAVSDNASVIAILGCPLAPVTVLHGGGEIVPILVLHRGMRVEIVHTVRVDDQWIFDADVV